MPVLCGAAPRQQPAGILPIPPRAATAAGGGPSHGGALRPSQGAAYPHVRDREREISRFHEKRAAMWERSEEAHTSRIYPRPHAEGHYHGDYVSSRHHPAPSGNGQWVSRVDSSGGGGSKVVETRHEGSHGVGGSSRGGPAYGEGGRAYDASSASPASSSDAKFGHMAPCWRLLEKARDYMEEVPRSLTSLRNFVHPRVLTFLAGMWFRLFGAIHRGAVVL